jgi:uncharacterized protein
MADPDLKPALPLPVPNFDNQGFWDGCRQHELRLQRCAHCEALRHPPGPMCPRCQSFDYDWVRASGRGTVYTFTVVHGPTLPAFQERAPYNVVVVQLDEGPFLVSNLVTCGIGDLRIGLPVEVLFEDIAEGATLPRFRPCTEQVIGSE